ncbi:MAG: twin-arginine translocase subunit TatC [Verrucomicrobiota bacterium]|jgi:sec-independent protein translocase protein TatC
MYLLKKVFELREKAHTDHEKPFLEHLEDLRIMVTRVVITLLVSMILCFALQEQLMSLLRAPAESVLRIKEQETMPDGKEHQGIRVPSIELWDQAKQAEQIAMGLNDRQREEFYRTLNQPDLEFHARSVGLLRAVKAVPEEKRLDFVNHLGVDEAMVRQLKALLESNPDVDVNAGSNIKMMSALKPTETFTLSMKLAFFAGIVLAFPLLLVFVLQFVLPGLHQKEKKMLWPAMLIGCGLFLGGVLFAYFFVLPRALLFFHDWSVSLGVSNDWRIGEYITFVTQFTLLFGLSFELPVVVMVLVKLGLLSYETMSKSRTYATLAIFVMAAIITPTPDILTLNLMALPMLLLYEICIWLAWFDRKKQREQALREEEELRQRRLEWMIRDEPHDEEKTSADGEMEDPESIDESGDDGWHDRYHHDPELYHDPYQHGLPDDEEWRQPGDAVVGDGETDQAGEDHPKT